MTGHDDVDARVRRDLQAARERVESVDEGHKRWNRMEEAMDAVCEEAVSILDQIGRYDQADEIQSHMAAHERFDLLLSLFADDAAALEAEAEQAGLRDQFEYCRRILPLMNELAAGERRHQPGA